MSGGGFLAPDGGQPDHVSKLVRGAGGPCAGRIERPGRLVGAAAMDAVLFDVRGLLDRYVVIMAHRPAASRAATGRAGLRLTPPVTPTLSMAVHMARVPNTPITARPRSLVIRPTPNLLALAAAWPSRWRLPRQQQGPPLHRPDRDRRRGAQVDRGRQERPCRRRGRRVGAIGLLAAQGRRST